MKSALLARVAGAAVGIVLLAGCGTSRRAQLERVAKDWCETIRASQVIPVYPLTEDLQPGDVFLVQVPVDRQQEIYKQKGFLPLDNHLARIDPDGYGSFYDHSFYNKGAAPYLPRDWMRPNGGTETSWEAAPNAAFPTYSFSVNRSAGINLAIPISGVPVGLSLMGTESANGSVTIDDARTLGIDTISLHAEVEEWASRPAIREFLANFAATPGREPRNYLRVVTRVYATGRVSVQLNDAKSIAGGGDVGVARPVDLFLARPPNGTGDTVASARENYLTGLANINSMGGHLGGPPTHRSGDHAGLTPGQINEISRAERQAREDERTNRRSEAAQRQKDLDDAEKVSKDSDQYKQLDAAIKAHETAKQVTATKKAAVDALQKELDGMTANDPGRPAKQQELANARTGLETAQLDEKDKAADVAKKQKAYDDSDAAKKVVAARGKLNVANQAVERLEQFAPGGSVRFTAASSRSVSMEEDFNPPLIIGYLGFDLPILAGGGLGRPIPTHALVDATYSVSYSADEAGLRELNDGVALDAMYDAIAADDNPTANSIRQNLDSLVRFIPASPQAESQAVAVAGPGGEMSYAIQQLVRPQQRLTFKHYRGWSERRDESRRVLAPLRWPGVLKVQDSTSKQWREPTREERHAFDRHLASFTPLAAERAAFDRARYELFQYYSTFGSQNQR